MKQGGLQDTIIRGPLRVLALLGVLPVSKGDHDLSVLQIGFQVFFARSISRDSSSSTHILKSSYKYKEDATTFRDGSIKSLMDLSP